MREISPLLAIKLDVNTLFREIALISLDVWRAVATRNGGEVVGAF